MLTVLRVVEGLFFGEYGRLLVFYTIASMTLWMRVGWSG